ncbi:hypothetical protein FO519_008446 [Halicephalobus sp. NKZ332]|nr:hypothetical protein FO519_008446 [Halicephalobus sp. NKZ332]
MKLNPDLYHDFTKELIPSTKNNPKIATKIMFLGKEPLFALMNFATKARSFSFENWSGWELNSHFKYSLYKLKIQWDNDTCTEIDLKDPYMKKIVRWILSFVNEVKINCTGSFPTDIMELLLKNPHITKIHLNKCDALTAKRLVESRKFDFVEMNYDTIKDLNDIHIDTKELLLGGISLEESLKLKNMNTTLLKVHVRDEKFDNCLLMTDVDSSSQSLEELKLKVRSLSRHSIDQSVNPERVLGFLGFLNTNLVNLKLLRLSLEDNDIHNNIDIDQGYPSILPDSIKRLLNYEEKLTTYNGRVKVKFNHKIHFRICSPSEDVVDDYIKKTMEEFQGFEYSSEIEDTMNYYCFTKSGNVAENFEVNIKVDFKHYKYSFKIN